jgi:hypothetical protein
MRWAPTAVIAAWALGGALAVTRPCRRRLIGVALAASIALGLAAAQVLPALEFSAETDRASVEDPIDVYPFSLEPIRLVELVWPNVFGTRLEGNTSWLEATRPDWARDMRV